MRSRYTCRAVGSPIARLWGRNKREKTMSTFRLASAVAARAALGAGAIAWASGLHAAGLFLPVGPASAVADIAPAERSAWAAPKAWERRVRIARHELTTARANVENAGAGRLLLDIKNGVRLDVIVERSAPSKWGFSLSGRVAGTGAGFVTLVAHQEAVAGAIWTPESSYELSYVGGGLHALREVTNAPVECAGALPSELSPVDATAETGNEDSSSVVDILVVWTPAAEEEYGGAEPQVLSRIDLLVAYANDAFERSGAFVSLNLVGAEKVDYLETNVGTDLDRLIAPDDGHMDGVHDRRDALGADLIYLMVGGGRGIAVNPGAFSVGSGWSKTFAHEIGHNFGIDHERHEFVGSGAVKTHQHGFTTGGCSPTIMSYGKACYGRRFSKVPFYASPWRYDLRDGRALGVTRFAKERGALGPADAVLTLNRNRHRVANYRPSRSGSAR